MSRIIRGIHHITAIAGEPRGNLEFYTGTLGLLLVKKTVNFDDPGTYHLYYGDETGRPGTIMTFFPWPLARPGSRGVGQATVTAFAVPEGSLGFWRQRLEERGVVTAEPVMRLDEEVLPLLDPDGLALDLVATPGLEGVAGWSGGPVPPERAIRGFSGVTLTLAAVEETATLVTEVFGLSPAGEAGARQRFAAPDLLGGRLDLIHLPQEPIGRVSAGSVHHVAWRAADEADQLAWRDRLLERGLHVTEVLDRQYFRSIYFREPGGVLFEIATDPPGFTADETVEELGTHLRLPPWLEPRRVRLERVLPPLPEPAVTTQGPAA